MEGELNIELEWLGGRTGSETDRAFYAEIGLAVGEDWLTLLEDLEAKTVTTHLRCCAHRLATWFASNWWRLRWEPEPRDWAMDTDWRIAHSIASAGGGYVWPNVLFASDGDSLAVVSRPRLKAAPYEPIRYLSRMDTRITAAEFERKVDAFLSCVLSRGHSLGIKDDALYRLWSEVHDERRDPEATRWRKLEALCGYDPDEAPATIIRKLINDKAGLGSGALEEVAAVGRHSTLEILQPILALAQSSSRATPKEGGFRVAQMPELSGKPQDQVGGWPWQRATKLAQRARKEWNLGNGPVSNKKLADLIGTQSTVFSDATKAFQGSFSMPILIRDESLGTADLYLNRGHPTSRRFAACRLLGDHLYHHNGGRLIPATEGKTARQQFQRAFAQELLCPFGALSERMRNYPPTDDEIEEAALHFDVSTRVIETTLVNKGELDRGALSWIN